VLVDDETRDLVVFVGHQGFVQKLPQRHVGQSPARRHALLGAVGRNAGQPCCASPNCGCRWTTPRALRAAVLARLGLHDAQLLDLTVFKRAYDARKKSAIVLIYTVDCTVADEAAVLQRCAGDPHVKPSPDTRYRFIGHAPADFQACGRPRPLVVGFGPCGLFAALILAQMGLRPLVLERGKAVRERTKDTWGLWRQGVLDPESNVQFGEGGAGTFSDGKLWSQISDPRHLTRKVLTEFVRPARPRRSCTSASRTSAPSGW
jgi:uncharacterized FAD-dependent dehydrogenase